MNTTVTLESESSRSRYCCCTDWLGYLSGMEIDSPPHSDCLSPRERIVQRLVQQGVPKELLDRLQCGLIAFVKENRLRIPELVSAILPTDEEVAEALSKAKAVSKAFGSPSLKKRFRESMVWLQWLMFEGDPGVALDALAKMSVGQRGVCGAVWGNNDIAYRCRTCEHDPTCAICVPCFKNGNHKDHDYSIIYTGGGCCDCGDVTAWKRDGFCSKHKGAEQIQPLPEEFANSVGPVLDSLLVCWKNKLLSAEAVYLENPRTSDRVAEFRKIANELTFVVVEMLLEFCKHSESLLSFVAKKVFSLSGLLDILVRAERFLGEVVRKLHELLLKLLAEPVFKYEFAKAFLNYYPVVIEEAIRKSSETVYKKYPLLSTFSVQIFTVPTLTPRLVREVNLLAMLLGCLGDIFISCAGEDGRLQVTKWSNLFEPTVRVIEDIRFVMSHVQVPKYVTHEQRDISRTWIRLLAFVQGMNPQKRETGLHIEEENENFHFPFALGHSITNINALLVTGACSVANAEETQDETHLNKKIVDLDDDDGIRHAKVGRISQESSVCSAAGRNNSLACASKVSEVESHNLVHGVIPSPVTYLIHECLRAIENCLGLDNTSGALPTTSNISGSNFMTFKKTLSKIKKGKYMFSKLSSSSEVLERPLSSPVYNHSSSDLIFRRQDSKPMITCEGTDNVHDTAVLDDSTMEGECATELEALRVLSLSDWPDIIYDVSSQDISLHIPLHRLLSLLLQKALRRFYDESAMPNVVNASSTNPWSATYFDFFGHVLGGCHSYGFSAFLMEHPLRIRAFCAEVHAGMWRKNGDVPLYSCEWYSSVRGAEQGLELDLFLLQCCAALAPADLYVNRIIERFGLSSYLTLNLERPSEYEPVLVEEMLTLIIQIVKERRFCGLTTAESLKRELIYRLTVGDATHSQLVKSLPRDLSKFEHLQEILDTVAVYSNPSGLNQGMYSLRWTFWKELDLYHPRWNPKELQGAEERYMRFCSVSALTTQLPRWTKIYHSLNGVARIATCKMVLQIVRAVLFYAVFTDKSTTSRAPDWVLLTALHLLSLALDICSVQKESGTQLCYVGDLIPMLAFAGEAIGGGRNDRCGEQSLLSLLVSLMRMHKKENLYNSMEAGNCDISSLIESLLKKFAEIDSGCMATLQKLAPEVVNHLSQPIMNSGSMLGSASDNDKRKAKARERQAAILEKMRTEQSKFLASITPTSDDELNGSKPVQEVHSSDVGEESAHEVCCLCHDPSSKNPLSFLVLLQKSRLVSFINKGPPSWEQVCQSGKEQSTASSNTYSSGLEMVSSSQLVQSSEIVSSSQLVQLVQKAVNEFSFYARCGDVNAFLEFIKTRFSSVRSIQLPYTADDMLDKTVSSSEMLEEDLYNSILKETHDSLPHPKFYSDSPLLGKYIAVLSRERADNPSASENDHSRNSKGPSESIPQLSTYDGFSPSDCDGIHLSSCGHAVHRGCLERYLSSLKERYIRRIAFEGGHIVDPDQGEFLCPVCRRLSNSVLPALPGHTQKVLGQPMISTVGLPHAEGPSTSSEKIDFLHLRHALTLIETAGSMVVKSEILRALPMRRNGRTRPNLEPLVDMLSGMYFPGKKDKLSGSARVSDSLIMWDTLKYSLISTEIAARSGRISMTPRYGLDSLYKELKSSGGFILSLLLKVIQSMRSKNPLHVLLRFRGIQLFAESIYPRVIGEELISSTCRQGGYMSSILKHIETDIPYQDIQFWKRASDPLLARDPFSSLMWVLFCLPSPFLSCDESFLCLVHLFYLVSVTQAIITYCGKFQSSVGELGLQGCLISDISNFMGQSGFPMDYFVSNYITDSCYNLNDMIRSFTFPFLRRCALLSKLLSSTASTPHGFDAVCPDDIDDMMDTCDANDTEVELIEVGKLENMFNIPQLADVVKDEMTRGVVLKWLHHFRSGFQVAGREFVLYSTPAVPFKLMNLPHVYHEILQRHIKQHCPECKLVMDDPALCLLCGRLCCPTWKSCCREYSCQTHATACGAGVGVFLLVRKTTILLQRSKRQALWPSPYLDAFGEEDIDMYRGKPLYLNEERYAALSYMVASHGLDRSTKVLGKTTIGTFFMI